MKVWSLFILAASCAFLFTGIFRRYAIARNLLDIPNKRSSHQIPTPHGGGVAIVLVFLIGLLFLWYADVVSTKLFLALEGAGGWIALIGFWDDHVSISVKWRLVAHFLGAAWVLAWLGGLPPLPVLGVIVDLGWFGHLLTAFYLVWLLNLYNFMDGIDGIAGIEAITVCLAGGAFYWISSAASSEWQALLLLFVAVCGFLPWNFPVARIFMGDVGSGFLGMILGVFSLHAAWVRPELFWSWIILLGAFVVDATVTLIGRILCGEHISEAHCGHTYQYAARKYGSHIPVSLSLCAINIFFLVPVAWLVAVEKLDGIIGVGIAYVPLVAVVLCFKTESGK